MPALQLNTLSGTVCVLIMIIADCVYRYRWTPDESLPLPPTPLYYPFRTSFLAESLADCVHVCIVCLHVCVYVRVCVRTHAYVHA